MPSQLLVNEHISFLVSKPFKSRGKQYNVGDDFDQSEARDIDTFVRARFLMPVVDDLKYKPRHWYREVQLREVALAKLNRENVQLRMHHEPDDDEVVDLPQLTRPETTPDEPETTDEPLPGEEYSRTAPAASVHDELYDPSYHTVREVNEYLAQVHDPEEKERILQSERDNRGRKGIVDS
jgi:hypothetical protein